MDIIICTTALSRPELHNKSIYSIIDFLKPFKNNIKWFINIDKTDNCKYNSIYTKKKLIDMLIDFNISINISQKPSFFNAVKYLLNVIYNHINTSTMIFWFEDDWILNKQFDLKMIYKYHNNNTFISLVFNKLGSFPPFIMGSHIYKILYTKFNTDIDIKNKNPESFSRTILRKYINKHKCIYYLICNDIYKLLKLNDKDLLKSITPDETYMKNITNYIICNDIIINDILLRNTTIVDKYIYHNNKNIVFIRFEGCHIYKTNGKQDYNNTFFKDIGRQWKYDN